MDDKRFFTSSRSFLFLGIALVGLAFVILPMKIPIQAQPGDVDYLSIGWLFTPIIGIWGLASIVLGLVQSSLPRRRIEFYLVPILAITTVGLAFGGYMAIAFGSGIIRSAGNGDPFWWFYFGLVLVPTLIMFGSTVKFLRTKEKVEFLANNKLRAITFVALTAAPLSYTTVFLILMYVL